MLKRIQKQRDNNAASLQAQKKRLRESNENSHELSDHEEAYEDANSKFSIIIIIFLFCSSSKSIETCLHLLFVILFSIIF